MKTRLLMVVTIGLLLIVGNAFAQMGGGNMGPGGGNMGPGPNPMPGPGPGTKGHMGGGMGYGMGGAGGMVSGMMGNTFSYGYLDVLNPINDKDAGEAKAAFEAFINSSNSNLQISEIWEYGTIFKAELSDTSGVRAFDLIADKFTGAVMPEMGMSMMLNASYGKGLYRTSRFPASLSLTPDAAKTQAQSFLDTNSLHYTLGTPETYPGYYKFHTTGSSGFGPDIMVNGYDGGIWMNTLYGLPVAVTKLTRN